MAHYAFLDENNIVTEVIVGKNEGEDGIDWEVWYGDFRNQICKRTSYNTIGNVHNNGGTPYRGNYAGIGYAYHPDIDAFVPPKPYASWLLDSNIVWQPPVAMPTDGNIYSWDEDSQTWVINAFVQPRPYKSWMLDVNSQWQAPTAMPVDGKMYSWNEDSQTWVEVNGN